MTDVVVGVAIVDWSGAAPQALVARRRRPPELAGMWEFPGGKVEPGESNEQALRRECREELAIEVILGQRLGKDLPLATGAVLRVWAATLPPGAVAEPIEHAELRWLTVDNLEELDWIPADRPLIRPLQALLRG